MKFLVLVNEAARGLARTDRKELSVRLLRGFKEAGAEAYVHCIDAPTLLREAKDAMNATGGSDFDALIVGGGDGLIAEIINAGTSGYLAIGVLPLGINNHFAQQLKVPLDLVSAVTALARGRTAEASVGEINGRIFLNFAAVGLPDVAAAAAAANENWHGILKRFVNLNDRKLRIRSRTHTRASDALTVIVCNNAHAMGWLDVPPSPPPEDGLMNVYVARPPRSRNQIVNVLHRAGVKLFNGAAPRFETMALPELRIESTRKQVEVSIDGDVWAMRPPLNVHLRERALRVLLPGDPTPPAPPEPRPSVEVTTHVDGLELEPEPRDTAHS